VVLRIALLAVMLAVTGSACGPSGSDRGETPAARGSLYVEDERARRGEEVFRRERCGRCHTLFERPPEAGPVVLPVPFVQRLFGSRVGPDLGLRGHSRSDDWQLAHLYAPGTLVPGSRMPASRHLFTSPAGGGLPLPTPEANDLVAFMQALGRTRRDIWAETRRLNPVIPPPPELPRERLLERGMKLYGRHCVPCHGAAGDGRGEAAPLLLFPPRDFIAARYRFRSTPSGSPPTAADLFRSITLGTGTGAAMPSFRHLTADDRWALVLRIKEFAPHLRGASLDQGAGREGGVLTVAGRPEKAVEAGRRWWRDLGCARCHGEEGRGMTRREGEFNWVDQRGVPVPRSGDLTHACGLRGGASSAALGRAVQNGVGDAMPAYAGALASPELAELVSFLLSLQDPVAADGVAQLPVTGPGTRSRR
jgi:mono/diheme cytochrome c family protein